ncbi:hypothetical protein NliqN6_3854 [Naganishia liquefaciens]|uniref:Homeobox domain-containing protein n=1 Tax=Naganishia liquefaciens TaxID=104408 RepID=A0A8H3TUL4_9TREE|nr:hypothetical protein NliqN6_3854 [Naganishia liquefaciens]
MSPAKRPLATPTPTTNAAAAGDSHKKRRRTSAEELKILEDAYRVNTLPSSEERQRLAERTGMTARAVQIWFQNKRQTEKRKMTQAMYPNVMIIPIHHPIDPSLATPNKGDPNAAASTSATPQSPWTTYHPHRPSHAHPGAAGLAAPGMPYPGGAGYIVQPIAGRPEGTPQTGFYPVMPPGMVPYPPPPPPGYALAPIASDEQRAAAENAAQNPTEGVEDEERLRTVSTANNAEEKPKPTSASASAMSAVHPGVPWQYYTPHPGYPPFAYGMPTPSTGPISAPVASASGQQAPATPTPTPAQQGAAYPGYPPPHVPGQGYYAQPYGYPPYGYPPYPYAAAPPAPAQAQASAPAREPPAAADTASSTALEAAATTPTRGADPTSHSQAPTSSAARHPTTMGALGYTFASSSERENTGSAAAYSQPSKVSSQDSHEDERDDAEGEGDDEELQQQHRRRAHNGSSPSPKHAASESNERARHPPSLSDAQSPFPAEPHNASRGDFHSRNSGEAARSGFRVTGETSALLGKEGEYVKGEEAVVVKIEKGEEVARETPEAVKELPAVASQQSDIGVSAVLVQPVPEPAQQGESQLFKAHVAIQRPRSSLGFAEPARRSTGSQRGILDEMCARRELPFRMIDEPDGRYGQGRNKTSAGAASSSSPNGRNPASDSDPFGGSAAVIPARRLSMSKPKRAKRPSSSSGLVIRRPARLPSRSPDIFDRMSSDPPSGGLEPSEDEDDDVPLRIRRARTEDSTGLGGDLSDTDIEDEDRVNNRPLRLPSSSNASDEYAVPSSTSTSRSLLVLATPDHRDVDGAAVALASHDQSSVLGGRKLRFVASDVLGGAGKKRKLELTEEDNKENENADTSIVTPAGGAKLKSRKEATRPSLGRMASLDYYAGSPAKRSCSLGAEARRLSRVVSKYQQKAPLSEVQVQVQSSATRPRHVLGESKAHRKLNGSSSAAVVQFGKTPRMGSTSGRTSVLRSLSVGNLDAPSHRSGESPTTARGRTEDEECARLLLGLGSSR